MPVFTLRITLRGISNPTVSRTIQVPGAITFLKLHRLIQLAFGWQECHLHEFQIPGQDDFVITAAANMEEDERSAEDETTEKVGAYLSEPGDALLYVYDFGDYWEHEITVLAVHKSAGGNKADWLLAAEGACPPEDCGGVHGYALLKEAMANPKHPEYKSYREWLNLGANDPFNPWNAALSDKLNGASARM
ncbi:MAG: plasmid pRiA4b ORF-3 family protein [Bacteroidetes bacterium]|nr:MAG: plasmid pRiA4b ORF-3 family protein [Bacteroidota bacterium]